MALANYIRIRSCYVILPICWVSVYWWISCGILGTRSLLQQSSWNAHMITQRDCELCKDRSTPGHIQLGDQTIHEFSNWNRTPPTDDHGARLPYVTSHEFVRVGNTSLYVISAFLDTRVSPERLRFVGLVKWQDRHTLYWCQFYNTTGHWQYRRKATLNILPEVMRTFRYLPYRITLGKCPVRGHASHVVVSNEERHFASWVMPIKVVEWIELYKMLGVEKFIIYDIYSCDPVIHKAMEYYIKKGIIELIPWQVPMKVHEKPNNTVVGSRAYENPDEALKCFGQVGALIDCVYRNMDDYEYILIVDYDEIIVPAKADNLYDMVKQIDRKVNLTMHASVAFNGSEFCSAQHYDNETGLVRVTDSYVYYRNDSRSPKSIVFPKRAFTVYAHGITKPLDGYQRRYIDMTNKFGELHHYRGGFKCPINNTYTGTSLARFQRGLREQVLIAKNEIIH